jgi:hypothetical protein
MFLANAVLSATLSRFQAGDENGPGVLYREYAWAASMRVGGFLRSGFYGASHGGFGPRI